MVSRARRTGSFKGVSTPRGRGGSGAVQEREPTRVSTTVIRNPDGTKTIIKRDFNTGVQLSRETRSSGGILISSSTPLSGKVRLPDGRIQVVTRSGRVTIRDPKTGRVERFRTDPVKARQFLSMQKAFTKQKLSKRIAIRIGKDPRVEALNKLGVKNARQFFELVKSDSLRIRGREISIVVETPTGKKSRSSFGVDTIKAIEKKKGLQGIREFLQKKQQQELIKGTRSRSGLKRESSFVTTGRGLIVLATIGALKGALSFVETIANPIKTAKAQFGALTHPVQTFKYLGREFTADPVGTIAEFYTFSKLLNLAGKTIKKSPVGKYVQEELFIRGQPKTIRPFVRKIIKSAKVQAKINPKRIKSLKRVDFMEIKSLTKTEAKALVRALRKTDSVVFGSTASRTLTRKRTPLPKDVDIATRNVRLFNQKFIGELPRNLRRNYAFKKGKLIRISNRQAIFDVKPMSRLIPQRSRITGKGRLPVVGFVRKLKRVKGSILPKITRKPGVSRLTIKTQKLIKVGKLKLIGFGEQTTRKALGTLQLLIKKDFRRAKDPQGFLISLQIQLDALKKIKPLTPIGKGIKNRRIRIIGNAISVLKSKSFKNLLEKRFPGITKEYPLITKIDTKKLKRINNKFVENRVRDSTRRLAKIRNEINTLRNVKTKSSKVKRRIRELEIEFKRYTTSSKLAPSRLPKRIIPSKLPKSKLPSKIPKIKFRKSKLPVSKVPRSRVPISRINPSKLFKNSKLPSSLIKTIIPISRIPISRLPPSRLPPLRPPSRLPPSKLPPSRLPPHRRVPKPKKRPKIVDREKQEQLKKLVGKVIQDRKLIYIPDLYSVIYGIKSSKAEKKAFLKQYRVFTGFERRKLI